MFILFQILVEKPLSYLCIILFYCSWINIICLFDSQKVWGSKWNERAYFSTRKVKLDHEYLSMAVLVQEVINADYAFVIHTTNPASGDSSEIYAEVCLMMSCFLPILPFI